MSSIRCASHGLMQRASVVAMLADDSSSKPTIEQPSRWKSAERPLRDAPPEAVGSTRQPRPHPLFEEVRRHRATLVALLTNMRLPAATEKSTRRRRPEAWRAAGRLVKESAMARRRARWCDFAACPHTAAFVPESFSSPLYAASRVAGAALTGCRSSTCASRAGRSPPSGGFDDPVRSSPRCDRR